MYKMSAHILYKTEKKFFVLTRLNLLPVNIGSQNMEPIMEVGLRQTGALERSEEKLSISLDYLTFTLIVLFLTEGHAHNRPGELKWKSPPN